MTTSTFFEMIFFKIQFKFIYLWRSFFTNTETHIDSKINNQYILLPINVFCCLTFTAFNHTSMLFLLLKSRYQEGV